MLRFMKGVFIALLSFSESLATKYVSLNNFILVDINHVELNYYPFVTGLDSCNGNCNTLDDSSVKICVPNKTEDVNFKVFNMIRIQE